MKWNKFQALVANNLNLAEVINWHISPNFELNSQQLRQWIEQKVDYIAVRPWESLDLEGTGRYEGTQLTRMYSVWFRVEGQELQYSDTVDEIDSPVSEVLDGVKEWHGRYWAWKPGNHRLIIEAITYTKRHLKGEVERESIDIYIPPQGYTP